MTQDLLKSKKFQIGFTLIELLIAVAIIVILVTIGAVSYTTVNRNARDAQRKTDLAKIATALEMEYSDLGFYPAANGSDYGTIISPTPNTLMMCFNAGHDPTVGDYSTYRATALAKMSVAQARKQLACQDFYTGSIKTYMEEVPLDPSNNTLPCGGCTQVGDYYYTYFSYRKEGTLCWEIGNGSPGAGGTRCTYQSSSSDFKPIAYKYKLVAVVESSSNATNATGDQDPSICRKPGYCYVVPSPNF